MVSLEDTIIAVASARNPGGLRGVVRLSGSDSVALLEKVGISIPSISAGCFRFAADFPLVSGDLRGTDCVPASFYVWTHGKSYTGQNAVEIHTVGCLPILDRILNRFCELGARLAGPGEFTLRAFLSGRLDLTQAEAVLGVIDATDEAKLNTALAQLAGGLAEPLHALRAELFSLLGHLEAGFDFADEDIAFITDAELAERLAAVSEQIQQLLTKMSGRTVANTRWRVVLYGAPNIGKSQLFNALLGQSGALVFDAPGTTRDYVTGTLALADGLCCTLVDTAGDSEEREEEKEESDDSHRIARQSQERARAQKEHADVRLLCFDTLQSPIGGTSEDLLVWTRWDLHPDAVIPHGILPTSGRTGQGVAELKNRLAQLLRERAGGDADMVATTQIRCRESLRLAGQAIDRAETLCGSGFPELLAAELRIALEQIGLMVGAVYTEELLDSIFSRFCVGK